MDEQEISAIIDVMEKNKPVFMNRVNILKHDPYKVAYEMGLHDNGDKKLLSLWISHDEEIREVFNRPGVAKKRLEVFKNKPRTKQQINDEARAAIDSVGLTRSLANILLLAGQTINDLCKKVRNGEIDAGRAIMSEEFKIATVTTEKIANNGMVRDLFKPTRREEQIIDNTIPANAQTREEIEQALLVTRAQIEELQMKNSDRQKALEDRQELDGEE